MPSRTNPRCHEKEDRANYTSPLIRITAILLYLLNFTYYPTRFLELLDSFALRAVKPAGFSAYAYMRSRVPRLKIFLSTVDKLIMICANLTLVRIAAYSKRIAPKAAIYYKRLYSFLSQSAPIKVFSKYLPENIREGLIRAPLFKSGAAIAIILISSLCSYAFTGSYDKIVPEEFVEIKETKLAAILEPSITSSIAPSITNDPPKTQPLHSEETSTQEIEKFKDIYDSNSLINLSRGRRDAKELSLTFDGGEANHAREILEILRAKEIQTTIFLTGRFIKENPEIVMEMIGDGHEIGNHTMSHPHLTDFDNTLVHTTLPKVTKKYFLTQLRSTAKLFREITGEDIAPFWRAPYGEINRELTRWAYDEGYFHVGWTTDYNRGKTLDTLDWVKDKESKNYFTAAEIREKILEFDDIEAGLKGAIILMHLGTNRREDTAVSILPAIIDDLRERGYRFVRISKMANAKFIPKEESASEILALTENLTPSL